MRRCATGSPMSATPSTSSARRRGRRPIPPWGASPLPYPAMVRDFQTVIGNETRAQMLEQEGKLPDLVVACVGGGSNAIGMFHPFIDDQGVEIHGVEAAGDGVDTPRHAATLS